MKRIAVLVVAMWSLYVVIGCGTSRPKLKLSELDTGYEGPRDVTTTAPQTETRTYDITDLLSHGAILPSAPNFEIAQRGRGGQGGGGMEGSQSGLGGGGFGSVPRQIAVGGGEHAAGEELWVISKPAQVVQQAGKIEDNLPGAGALMTKRPGTEEKVAVPLKHTDVKAWIVGYIATVNVRQQYHNPYDEKIEAVYVFPLPQNAAVNEFLMTIGERKIRGIIREREEAEKIYKEAKSQGYVASLMTQERPNIFTQSVANIEPGKAIDIDIKYFHTLEYVDGWYEWVFPMVVGPRFNPPGYTEGIGAKAHGQAVGVTGQMTEVQYLRPNQRSGHDISLSVNLSAGVKIEKIESVNHKITTESPELGFSNVTLNPSDSIPNKDFVLRYKVAADQVKSALMVQRDEKNGGGYFTLMLIPPESLRGLPRQPLEMVFTLDVSGSMSGVPIEQSRAAIRYALTHMRPDDTFQVIRFASSSEAMSEQPLPATRENVARALRYINQTEAGGGTMMLEGIRKSLNFPRDPSRLRFVAFLTDGYIGNEVEILREVHNSLRDSRIFSFGVGSSPNRYLLDGMARMGAGAAAYLSLNEKADDVMSAYFERISHPALTDIDVDFGTMRVSDVFAAKVPDLFVGRPVILTGRFKGRGETAVRVKGKVGGETREFTIPVNLDDKSVQHQGISCVWARAKITDICDKAAWDHSENWADAVKTLAIDYGLMSQYTAFVAVDSSTQTAGTHGTTVAVPVPVPDGVRYETTVGE